MTEKESIGVRAYFVENPVLLEGLTRAGKFLLGKLMTCCERVEHPQYVSILEHIPYLARRGFITDEAAVTLLRIHADEHAYNMAIGRNLNLRLDDASSLYNTPDYTAYLRRSFSEGVPGLLAQYTEAKRMPCFITHEVLSEIDMIYTAFPSAKVVNLQRHPVDVVASWWKRGWGHRFGTDPLAFVPVLKGVKGSVPWYAASWAEEYEMLPPLDRVIRCVATLVEMGEATYRTVQLGKQQGMLRVTYEDLVERPQPTVERLAAFLGTTVSPALPMVIRRERLGQAMSPESRRRKWAEMEPEASAESLQILNRLAQRYETVSAAADK